MDQTVKKTNVLFVDFSITHNDKTYFIEYNGEQHYKYTPYFHKGGIVDFDLQVKRDNILKNYCNNTLKIELIIFKYNDPENFIENTLSSLFL